MSRGLDKSAKVISNMFTTIAPRYDLMNDVMTGFTHRKTRKFAINLVKKKKIKYFLDLASGTGDFTFLASAALNSETQIVGCDFSKGMLHHAKHRLHSKENKNKKRKVALINSDISYLPFSNGLFDTCSIVYGLRNVNDPLWVLTEINRVTTSKGNLIIVESSIPHNWIVRRFLSFYFKKIVPIIASLFSSASEAYDYYFESVEQFKSPEEIFKLLKKARWKRIIKYRLLFDSVIIYNVFNY
jgi:demethylmenaquinone methyltransferase/2-methoxy-6-polyprenyl-1,4-benzoquinol methylase